MRKRLTIYALLVMAAATAMAQHHDTEILTLDSCKALALRNQAKMQVADLKVEAARQTKMAALTKYFPQLSGTAAWFHSKDYMIDINNDDIENSGAQLDISGSFQGNSISSNDPILNSVVNYLGIDVDASLKMLDHGAFANLLLTQPIFAGGRIVTGNQLAKLGITAAEIQREMTLDEVMMNVEEHYWLLATLHTKMEALQQALVMIDTLRRDAEAGTSAGVIGKNDLLKVKLKQNELQAAHTQLRNGITLATMALLQYIGVPYDATKEYQLQSHETDLGEQAPRLLSQQDSTIHRKEAELLALNARAEKLKHRMVVGEALPQIAIGATYGYNNMLSNNFSSNGMLFVSAQIPITAWWEGAHNAKKQKAEQQIAEINQKDLSEQLWLQNQQIYNEMIESLSLAKTKRQAVSDAEENLAEVRNFYEAGMCSMSDYLEAQTLLQQAKTDLADQQMSYRLKSLKWRQISQQ